MSVSQKIDSFIAAMSRKLRQAESETAWTKFLRSAREIQRKIGVREFLHWIDFRKTEEALERSEKFRKFYAQHQEEIKKLHDMLEDDFSRRTLERTIKYRQTCKMRYLLGLRIYPQYFLKDIFSPVQDEVYVDGGAFDGETIESFIKYFSPRGGYKRIYAWEPDDTNMKKIKGNKNINSLANIVYIPCGLWSEKDELHFAASGSGSSRITDNTGLPAVDADENIVTVNVDSIDNVCSGDKVTFIKMDIEGSELEALKGAVNVIKRDKPKLAICVYHKPEDIYEIPFWIKQTVPEYKLYLRHHQYGHGESVIYATL